jgi:protein-tyrosine kinase
MSRNFELMQKAQERGDAFPAMAGAGLLDIPHPDARGVGRHWREGIRRAPLGNRTAADAEILSLVNSLFIVPERLPGLHEILEAPRLVVFSDAQYSSGSSGICARAAEILAAQVRNRVCLVDANICSPSFHERFGLCNGNGWLNSLAHNDPIAGFVEQIGSSNLWVMTCGSLLNGSAELDFSRLRTRVEELRREFDFLLVDAPAVNAHPTALLLGQLADGLVMVIEANVTRRETAQTAKQELELAGVSVVGAILNNRTFSIPDSLYRHLQSLARF